jgi:hypothetical protein
VDLNETRGAVNPLQRTLSDADGRGFALAKVVDAGVGRDGDDSDLRSFDDRIDDGIDIDVHRRRPGRNHDGTGHVTLKASVVEPFYGSASELQRKRKWLVSASGPRERKRAWDRAEL